MYVGRRVGKGIVSSLKSGVWRLGNCRSISSSSIPNSYDVEKVEHFPTLNLTATLLRHRKTQTQHLHIDRSDPNNVFCVGFRTTPTDSSGVPHILEHTVLCGSQQFPCRDPFFKMLNRSLSTFMNAMTGPDYTFYPFSTTNSKDFVNLLNVYADACFRPLLREGDFLQEGWRLEQSDLTNVQSPIQLKGVVFNEMKGVFSSADNIFSTKLMEHLYPDTTYHHCYGGDPTHIPKLSWSGLRDFHHRYYHPSNAKFYTYGNTKMSEHLQHIEDKILSHYEYLQPNSSVKLQPRWASPKSAEIDCPVDPLLPADRQTTVARGYLMNTVDKPFETFCLAILGELLVSGESSPFYQALLLSGMGSDYSPATGYESSLKQPMFAVGLKGVAEGRANDVLQTILETFEQAATEGFEQKRIDAILHRIELALKHQTTSFGLHLIFNVLPAWMHDANPIELMSTEAHVVRLRKLLAEQPDFWKEKIEEYFLKNPHQLTLVMKPNSNYEKERKQLEEKVLNRLTSGLNLTEKQQILAKAQGLVKRQSEKENLSCLPTLRVSDIEKRMKQTSLETVVIDGVPTQKCLADTNEVTYFRGLFNVSFLPKRLKELLPLFASVLTRMGVEGMDSVALSQEIELRTGGMDVDVIVREDPSDPKQFTENLLISSYALKRNAADMFTLWNKVLNTCDWTDQVQFQTLVRLRAAELAESVPQAGHNYAVLLAGSVLGGSAQIKELYAGISQVRKMKEIAEMENLDGVVAAMKEIATAVLNKSSLKCSINTTSDLWAYTESQLKGLMSNLKKSSTAAEHHTEDQACMETSNKLFVEFPFSVHYCAKTFNTAVPYTSKEFASLRVLAKLLTAKYLHGVIREKGGAYGGGAMSDDVSGFQFYSYRDPRSMETVKSFDDSVKWFLENPVDPIDIDEAKLRVFQKVDAPIAPGHLGQIAFQSGITDAMRQSHRDQLLSVTRDDLVEAAEKYLRNSPSATAILGPSSEQLTNDSTWKSI